MSTLLDYRRMAEGSRSAIRPRRLCEHAQAGAQASADSDCAHALRDHRAASWRRTGGRERRRPHALCRRRAAGRTHHRDRPRARRRRPPGVQRAGRDLAGELGRPLCAQSRPARRAARPEFSRGRPRGDRQRRRLPLPHDQARRVSVGKSLQRVASESYPFQLSSAPTSRSRLVTQMYFPGDPLLELDPIFQGMPEPAARERLVCALHHRDDRCPSARSAIGSTSCCAAEMRRPLERRGGGAR